MTTPIDHSPLPTKVTTLDVTASFAQTDGASVTPGCEFGHRLEGTYVCPGTTASLAFYGSSVEIFLNGTTQCQDGVFDVLLDEVDVLAPQYAGASLCPNATRVQQTLSASASHFLAIVNDARNTAPVLITRAFVENYSAAAVSTPIIVTATPTPSTNSGPVESASATSRRNLVAVLVPSILIPVLIIVLAIGSIAPWWRRRMRKQRALMAPSAAFRAENPGLVSAPPVPWTPIDVKRGPGERADVV